MSGARTEGCKQPEAFCLMLYRDTAGNEEWIWNSRDAVTPFIVTSRAGLEATHVEWQRDRYAPDHLPKVGDRIFVNLTLERARERRRAYVDRNWDDARHSVPMSERYPSKDEAIERLAKHDYESFGAGTTPDLIEVTKGVLADLMSRRRPYTPRTFA